MSENTRETQLEQQNSQLLQELNLVKADAYDQNRAARQQIESLRAQGEQAINVFKAIAAACGADEAEALEQPGQIIDIVTRMAEHESGASPRPKKRQHKK